jgi:iron complex transport system substrate-binding protein
MPEPVCIVSLFPSLTETLCAIGACGLIAGTDRHSNHPAEVLALPKLGGLEDLQVERIVALKPDLVLTAGSVRALARLRELGLPVLALEPRTLQDLQRVMVLLGRATGRTAEAAARWQALQARLATAASALPPAWRGASVYFEISPEPYVAGQASFIGEVLAQVGLSNIVAATLGPFPRLNSEFVLKAQPALVLATARAVSEMPSRPGWARLVALQRGQHCGFGPAVFDTWMRPGPRLADAAEALAACLAVLPAPAFSEPLAAPGAARPPRP